MVLIQCRFIPAMIKTIFMFIYPFALRKRFFRHNHIGNCKPEPRAFSHFRVNTYFSTQLFHDTLTDGKSQSRTMHKRIEFHKTLEDMRQLLLLYSYTRVLNIEFQFFPFQFVTHADASFGSELDGLLTKLEIT